VCVLGRVQLPAAAARSSARAGRDRRRDLGSPRRIRLVALGALLLAAGCGGGKTPTAPFTPRAIAPGPPPRVVYRASGAPGTPGLHRYEYVLPDRSIDVYEASPPFRLVERVHVPQAHSLRGVAMSPRTATLYLSVGGNGGDSGNGGLLAYDLRANRVLWRRAFPTGTDGLAVTPDGSTLIVPEGERSFDDIWWVVDARTGRVTHEIRAAPGPHNTIVSPDGKVVYLGPRNSRFLVIASTRTDRVVRRVGPLKGGVRPFTVDPARGLAYTTATGFLGFQVSSLRTGRLLYTVPIRFPWRHSLGTPSHGISVTPNGKRLAVIDVPNSTVHVFDVSRVPAEPPRLLANVQLDHPMSGKEQPCGGDCGRAGWLQHSLDGRYLWVGDDGDVISTATNRVVGFAPALANSRYLLEVDWRGNRTVATSTRSGFARDGR
jgi:sugar lactone lactonase YvrE